MEEKKLNRVEIELTKINGISVFVGKIIASAMAFGFVFELIQKHGSHEIFSNPFLSLLCVSSLVIIPAVWSNISVEIKSLP